MRNAFADTDLKRNILDILYESYGLDPYEEATSDYQRRKQPIIISRPTIDQSTTTVKTIEAPKKPITVPKYQPNIKVTTVEPLAKVEKVKETPKYSKPQIIVEERNIYNADKSLPDSYCDCSSTPFQPILPSSPTAASAVTKPPQYSTIPITLPRYAQPKQQYHTVPASPHYHVNTQAHHHQRQPPITHHHLVQPHHQRYYYNPKPIVQQQHYHHLPTPYTYRLA